jgi:hypothetical protein
LDFSPLAGLADTFFKARENARKSKQEEETRATLASLGQGDADYDTVGRKLLSLGELQGGLGFLKLGQETKDKAAQRKADSAALSILGGGAPSYGTSSGTSRANIERGTVHVAEDEDDVQRLERATGMAVDQDLDKVVRTVYGEAGGEGIIGQRAVASVIANRARESGMTPTDVVLAKGQFEPWSDTEARARMESLDANSPEYRQLSDLVRPVLAGQSADPTGGATHFYAPKAQAALGRDAPSWDDGTGQDIGNHRFFRHGYGPQGKVQVAQADAPAPGAQNAQGFAIPGQEQPSLILKLEQALASPNLSDGARKALERRLDREYKRADEAGKLTDEQREYQMAREQGYKGSFMQFKTDLKKAGATTINNNAGGAAVEPEFNKATGKAIGERFDAISKEGDTARSDLAMVDQLRSLGGAINFKTMPALRGELAKYGVKIGDDVGEIQAYNSIIDKLTPAQRIPGSGASSDLDVKMFKSALPQLINTPDGNGLIMEMMQALGEDKIARAVIAERAQTGEITPAQAINELRAMPSPLAAYKQRLDDVAKAAAAENGAPDPNKRVQIPQGYTASRVLSEAKDSYARASDAQKALIRERVRSYGIDPKRLD